MIESRGALAELEKEIRRIIMDNEKFLTRIMDEDFSDEEEDMGEDSEPVEDQLS
jgi:hypothetical protein